MTRDELTQKIIDRKNARGVAWGKLAEMAGRSPCFVTAALLGQHALSAEEAGPVGEVLELSEEEVELLQKPPYRGSLPHAIPTDPLIYRFYELMQVYGTALKALIEEEFGDGIMSAIDFEMDLARVPDPKGDRVQVTFNGKFLPFRHF